MELKVREAQWELLGAEENLRELSAAANTLRAEMQHTKEQIEQYEADFRKRARKAIKYAKEKSHDMADYYTYLMTEIIEALQKLHEDQERQQEERKEILREARREYRRRDAAQTILDGGRRGSYAA